MSERALDAAYYWSPNEAAAILEYLDRLRNLIWEMYGEDIGAWQREAKERDAAHRAQRDEHQQVIRFDDLEDWD